MKKKKMSWCTIFFFKPKKIKTVMTGHTQTIEILPESIIHTSLSDFGDHKIKSIFSLSHLELQQNSKYLCYTKRHWQAAMLNFSCPQYYLIIRKQALFSKLFNMPTYLNLKSMVSSDRPYVYFQLRYQKLVGKEIRRRNYPFKNESQKYNKFH